MSERLSPQQIDDAKRTDLVALVSRHVKLSRRGRTHVGLCPFHDDHTPSFKLENGRFHCFGCGADGDAIEWLRRTANMPFREAVAALGGSGDALHTSGSRQVDRNKAGDKRVAIARAKWTASLPGLDPCVASYLSFGRLIENPDNPSLRSTITTINGIDYPTLVAAMVSLKREICAVQLTYIDPDEPRKANLPIVRKTFGVMGDGAVRLGAAGGVLGIAEGAETGLSAMQLCGIPVWCCLGAARMHHVAIPDTVRELHIFSDNDVPGRAAAERTADRHKHRRVIIHEPPNEYKDWNDLLRGARHG